MLLSSKNQEVMLEVAEVPSPIELALMLEVAEVPSPIELARKIQSIGDRVAQVEERVVVDRRKTTALNSVVADQGEVVLTIKTVVSGCVGEADRLNYGLGTTNTRIDRVEDLAESTDRRLRKLEGVHEGRLTVNAMVGFALGGSVLVLGLWNLNARITAESAATVTRLQVIERAIGVQQQELSKAREQQRVDAQYLVNELAKKRSK